MIRFGRSFASRLCAAVCLLGAAHCSAAPPRLPTAAKPPSSIPATPFITASPAQYRAWIQSSEKRISEQIGSDVPLPDNPSVDAALTQFGNVRLVGPAHGPWTYVNNSALATQVLFALRSHHAPRLTELDLQLRALLSQLGPLREASATPGDAERQVKTILAEKTFSSDPYPPPTAAQLLLTRFIHWLNRIFKTNINDSAPEAAPSRWFIDLLYGLVFTFVAGVLLYVLVPLLSKRPARRRSVVELSSEEEALAEARDSDSLIAMAHRLAAEGEFRRAFRLVYLASLFALDTDGIVRFNRARTNWEYLRDLRQGGAADSAEAFVPLTRDFDRVWYGLADADQSDFDHALVQYDAIRSLSGAKSGARESAGAGSSG